MHIFTKLIYAGTLSALLTNALRFEMYVFYDSYSLYTSLTLCLTFSPPPEDVVDAGDAGDTMRLTLHVSEDFDAMMHGSRDFTTSETVTLVPSGSNPLGRNLWQIRERWNGAAAEAVQFDQDYEAWLDEVSGAHMVRFHSYLFSLLTIPL